MLIVKKDNLLNAEQFLGLDESVYPNDSLILELIENKEIVENEDGNFVSQNIYIKDETFDIGDFIIFDKYDVAVEIIYEGWIHHDYYKITGYEDIRLKN